MNQTLLGVLRSIGYVILFSIITTIVNDIPIILPQLLQLISMIPTVGPVIAAVIPITISTALTAYAGVWEHQLAQNVGYNLPAGQTAVDSKTGKAV